MPTLIFTALSFFKNMSFKKVFIAILMLVLVSSIFGVYVYIQRLNSNIDKLENTVQQQDIEIQNLRLEKKVLEKNKKKIEESLDIVSKTIKKMQEEQKNYEQKVIVNKKIIKEYIKVEGNCEETDEKKEAEEKLRQYILNKFGEMK